MEVISFFLEAGAPVDLPSKAELSQRPIHWAAANGHEAVVHLLLEAGVPPNVEDQRGCTPLILAAQNGHTPLCCYLIVSGAQPSLCDVEGDNALHWAAFQGRPPTHPQCVSEVVCGSLSGQTELQVPAQVLILPS